MAPPIVAGAIEALKLVTQSNELQEKLKSNTAIFRKGLEQLGFTLLPGEHPIVPIMINDAASSSTDRVTITAVGSWYTGTGTGTVL